MTERRGVSDYQGQLYPVETITVPLVVFHGEKDDIVDVVALQDLLRQAPAMQLRHFQTIPGYEHMDLIWASDCHSTVFETLGTLMQQELKGGRE